MTMFQTRDSQLEDFHAIDAYRAWLISRDQAPMVSYAGDRPWKRLRGAARRLGNHVLRFFAAIRVALVADKMRRAQQELARVHVADVPLIDGRRR
jgi:hypothetical protein